MSDSELVSHCKQGNIDTVRQLLASNADVNGFIGSDSPLFIAVQDNNLGLLDAVLQAGADTSQLFNGGRTALIIAAQCGYIQSVQCLLKHQPAALLDARDRCGRTALFTAIMSNKLDVASTLFDAGADATIVDNTGMTPLMECTDVGLVRRLLELGVDVNARSRCGDTALLVACQRGNIEMASFLLTCGARTDAGGHWDILLRDACRAGRTEMAALLLTFDNITMCRDIIALALQDPARVEILRLLLQRFPDCESPGRPLLHEAVKVGNLEAVRMLVEVRPPGYVDIRGLEGRTLLFDCYEPVVMRLLLELGADPRAADINGQTPIVACINPACVRLLLDAAPDQVSIRDHEGRTAMMHFSCDRHHEALDELFRYCEEHGVDAGVNNRANNGDTVLHIAMSTFSNPRVVKLLLEKGADALASGCDGMTVLMKPFRGPMHLPTGFQMPAERPAWTSVSLEAVLDAVLAHGAEATVEDPDAKRRRTNKQ